MKGALGQGLGDRLVDLSQVRLRNSGPASDPPVSVLYDFLGSRTTDYCSPTSSRQRGSLEGYIPSHPHQSVQWSSGDELSEHVPGLCVPANPWMRTEADVSGVLIVDMEISMLR